MVSRDTTRVPGLAQNLNLDGVCHARITSQRLTVEKTVKSLANAICTSRGEKRACFLDTFQPYMNFAHLSLLFEAQCLLSTENTTHRSSKSYFISKKLSELYPTNGNGEMTLSVNVRRFYT